MHCSYAPQPSHTGPRREMFFNATLVELQNWLYDLPDDLRLDVSGHANTCPQAYTLHMTFHTAVILREWYIGQQCACKIARLRSDRLAGQKSQLRML